MASVPKKVFDALGRVFACEIEGRMLQSKAAIYRELVAAGLVEPAQRTYGKGWSAVTCSGYELTHRGRYLYCSSCDDGEPL
jgi:hypothetical protein